MPKKKKRARAPVKGSAPSKTRARAKRHQKALSRKSMARQKMHTDTGHALKGTDYIPKEAQFQNTPHIEEILHKSDQSGPDFRKHNMVFEGMALALPLAVSFIYYIFTISRAQSPVNGEMLSPGGTEALVMFLLGFIIIYAIFLVYKYRELYQKYSKKSKTR